MTDAWVVDTILGDRNETIASLFELPQVALHVAAGVTDATCGRGLWATRPGHSTHRVDILRQAFAGRHVHLVLYSEIGMKK